MTEKERERKRAVIIESLGNGATKTSACEKAGIDRGTFYHWVARSRKFKRQVEEAILSQIGVVEDALYRSAQEGNVSAQKFFLCNRASRKWRERFEQTFLGELDITLKLPEDIDEDKV